MQVQAVVLHASGKTATNNRQGKVSNQALYFVHLSMEPPIIDLTQDDYEVAMDSRDKESLSPATRFSASRFQLQSSHSLIQQATGSARSDTRPSSRSSEPLTSISSSSSTSRPSMGHQNSTPAKTAKFNHPHQLAGHDQPRALLSSRASPSSSRLPFRDSPTPSKRANMSDSAAVHTPLKTSWNVGKLERALADLTKDVDRNHAKLVQYSLKTAAFHKPRERRHLSASADLADLKSPILANDAKQTDTMKVQLKVYRDNISSRVNAGKKKMAYGVTCIKSNRDRVPRYRFHHIEVSRNILSPNTNLKFIPHLRDMKENEEERYRRWIMELDTLDVQSGFSATSSNRAEKAIKMLKDEVMIELSLYIDRWTAKLGLENCTKSTLARWIAENGSSSSLTPQQKSSIINRHRDEFFAPQAMYFAKIFTEAFDNIWEHTDLTLEDLLVHDETVESVVENKKLVKDGESETEEHGMEQLMKTVHTNLESYTILGCLYCYTHSCEHGYHDKDNRRAAFGAELVGGFGELMRQNLADYLANPQPAGESVPCRSKCYLEYLDGNRHFEVTPWSEDELMLLRGLYIALAATNLPLPCLVSSLVGRFCWEVYREIKQLGLQDRGPVHKLAKAETAPPKMKAIPWYDRRRKELKQDWQEHLLVHEFTRREVKDPCHHDGPCDKECPCVEAKLLCDRFCRCTVENCVYKFTGCACHANGKTCTQQRKEGRPCICVQLNRECDPGLCTGCGALERADPRNAHDAELHATGCQNVALQGKVPKAVLLGESQIPGCGYGLFAAEDISQDEFVIEYLGELISHDEGVRREARRGDVFDEQNHSSYLFTLLDVEGIWVDAAIYGNLSRYINHASEADKIGKKQVNIVPQILYVNGDFRIKFRALRDIKAGEELFFNYGENFPNLTKKLLDSKSGEATQTKRGGRGGGGVGGGRGSRGGRGRGGRGGRGRGGIKLNAETKRAPVAVSMDYDEDVNTSVESAAYDEQDDEEDDDFNPVGGLSAKRGGVALGVRGGARKRKRDTSLAEDSVETDSPPPRGVGSRGGRVSRFRGSRGGSVRGTRGGARGGGRGGKRAAQAQGESTTTTAAFALDEQSTSISKGVTTATATRSTSTADARQEPPHAILGTPSSRAGRFKRRRHNDEENDGDPDFKGAIARSGASQRSPSLRRRSTRPRHIPDSDGEEQEPVSLAGRGGVVTPTHARWSGSDEGSAYGSSPLDRSQRKRQRPARYRDSEE